MLGRVVSAQDEFRGFLRDLESPAMRSAGLRGSAGRYYLPSLSCFAFVGSRSRNGVLAVLSTSR
jgi:hypothetical protein